MLSVLASLAGSEILLGLVGSATAALTFRWWRGRSWVGIAYGLVGIGVLGVIGFAVVWLAPAAAVPIAVLVVLGSGVALVMTGAWRRWHAALPLTILVAAVSLAYVGVLGLWGISGDPFGLIAVRFGTTDHSSLPNDNQLPWLLVQTLARGASTHDFSGDWNGSDRPPLLAGVVELASVLLRLVGIVPATAAFGASVAGQLLWIPAVYALARSLSADPRGARVVVLFCSALGTTLVNSLYTWPKMTSAALVIAAVVLLLDLRHGSEVPLFSRLPVALVAFTLGLLAHGAAAFAIPLLVVLGLIAVRARSISRTAISLLAGGVVSAIIYLPWALFQRTDPPGDRLLKWHLAGVIPIDDRSFLTALGDSYSHLTLAAWLAGRLQNLLVVLSPGRILGAAPGWAGPIAGRRDAEFFDTAAAFATAGVVALAVTIAIIVRVARRVSDRYDRRALTLLIGCVLSVLFWCCVMFIPGSTFVHQGSQVWIFVIAVVAILWLWRRARPLAWVVMIVQSVELLVVYLPNLHDRSPFSPPGAMLLALGLALAVASVVPLRWRGRRNRIDRL